MNTRTTRTARVLAVAGKPRAAVRTLAIAALAFIPACATAPHMIDQIEQQQSDLLRRMQRAIELCQGDQGCIERTRKTYEDINAEYEKLRLQILREQWDDARKTRDELIKKLLELIPKYPDLKSLLDELLRQQKEDKKATGDGKVDATPKSSSSGAGGANAFSQGAGSNGKSSPDQSGLGAASTLSPAVNYDLSGYFNNDGGPLVGSYTIAGTISVSGTRSASGFTGKVTAGKLILGLSDGSSISFPIDTANAAALPSTVITDASGAGRIFLVLSTDALTLPANPLSAMIGPITTVSLPITMDAAGGLHFNFSHGLLRNLFPYEPWIASDYDSNGTLDENADLAAFLAGWTAHELRADINLDGLWNDTDIDLWFAHFQEDAANQ